MRRLEKWLVGLEVFLSVGATAGAYSMLSERNGGETWDLATLNDTPFDSYLIPGLTLLLAVGVLPLLVALATWVKAPGAEYGHIVAGVVLMGWISVQVTMIEFSWLQPAYFVLGGVIAGLGVVNLRAKGMLRVGAGEGFHLVRR